MSMVFPILSPLEQKKVEEGTGRAASPEIRSPFRAGGPGGFGGVQAINPALTADVKISEKDGETNRSGALPPSAGLLFLPCALRIAAVSGPVEG